MSGSTSHITSSLLLLSTVSIIRLPSVQWTVQCIFTSLPYWSFINFTNLNVLVAFQNKNMGLCYSAQTRNRRPSSQVFTIHKHRLQGKKFRFQRVGVLLTGGFWFVQGVTWRENHSITAYNDRIYMIKWLTGGFLQIDDHVNSGLPKHLRCALSKS